MLSVRDSRLAGPPRAAAANRRAALLSGPLARAPAVHATACMRPERRRMGSGPTPARGLPPVPGRRPPRAPAPRASSSASASSPPSPPSTAAADDLPVFDVHLLLAVARMRATDAFRKEASLLYKPADDDGERDNDDAGDDADEDDDARNNAAGGGGAWEDAELRRPKKKKRASRAEATTFSLLRAAALLTAALYEPQLCYDSDVEPALDAAARAAQRRLLRPLSRSPSSPSPYYSSPALDMLRRCPRPDTEQLERIAAAVADTLRLDARLRENVEDPHDPRNHSLDRDVLRALAAAAAATGGKSGARTGPAMAAVVFAELARRLGAGVALAGTHDRPLLRLFDRRAAEAAPTSADVAAGDGAASAWAETPSAAAGAAAPAVTPVVPPPSVIVDPCAALLPQEGDSADDDDGFSFAADALPERAAFCYAWLPEAAAWVPTAALDRALTHPDEPPRGWTMLEPAAAPPLATRALLLAALAAAKRSHAASGRFDDALAACRLARSVDPLDLDELRDEGALLVGVGRWAEGAARLREYLAVAPGGPPDRAWVEAEAARAGALAELEALRARRAREAAAAEEEEEGGGARRD